MDELSGLGSSRPSIAAVLSVCLLSLTGLPPLAGFWGKLLIFGSAVNVVPGQPFRPTRGHGSSLPPWWAY